MPNLKDDLSLESKEKGEEIKFTPDYEANKRIFWHVFKELSKNGNRLLTIASYKKGLFQLENSM
jgi:hypothetical protein